MIPTDIASFIVLSAPPVETPETVSAVSTGCRESFSLAQVPALTAALRAGNEGAYCWLHAQWNGRLSRYCYALAAGDAALAQEIAQATYLRIVRHMRVLPNETALWNWMARAARSAMQDQRRTGGRYRRALARFADWLSRKPVVAASGMEARLESALESALAQLSDEDRSLISDRYFDHQTLDELAIGRGLSARAVEGRLARLRSRLHELIREECRRREDE